MASPEALDYFYQEARQQDPSNKQCFECNAPNPSWCDLWHAIYVCLECSGKHRSIGTHISFVRSLNMDGWSDAHLKRMKLGGNARCFKFLKMKNVATLGFHQKWNSDASFMYKDMLTAELEGRVFNEKTWQPPQFEQRATTAAGAAAQQAGTTGTSGGSKYQGIGSQAQQQSQGDTFGSLMTGLTALTRSVSDAASNATKVAIDSASAAAQKTKEFANSSTDPNTGVNVTDSVSKASAAAVEGWSSLTAATTKGWGNLTSWAKSYAGNEDAGLDAALSNLKAPPGGGSAPSSISSAAAKPAGVSSNGRTVTPPKVTSPVNRTGTGDWEWNPDDDDRPRANGNGTNTGTMSKSSSNSSFGVSPVQKGAPINSLKRKPVTGKKDE